MAKVTADKKTILLVEDELLIAMNEKMSLEEYGYEIIIVNSGEKAFELFAQTDSIDLVLMDINLGNGIDGPQTATKMLGKRNVPIVFLSSHTEPEVVEKTEKITSYGYVVKNTGITALDASIKMAFKLFDANKKIVQSEIKLKTMISNISDVIAIIDEKGIIKYNSPNIEKWFGWGKSDLIETDVRQNIHEEDIPMMQAEFLALLDDANTTKALECRFKHKDGNYRSIKLTQTNLVHDQAIGGILLNFHDITERKFQEDEREATSRLINLLNAPGDFKECLANLTVAFQNWSDCEAVGIRLKQGEDFPYYETRGFAKEFILSEKYLCSRSADGVVLHDTNGNPVLECMCGNILSGRFDPTKPFFTPQGSFWTNSTTELLTSTIETDQKYRARNRCNSEGYESMALIPLRDSHQVFGLLQFNDRRKNHFTAESIGHFERMADSLAIALSRRQAEDFLAASEKHYHLLFDSMTEGFALHEIILDKNGKPVDYRFLDMNPAFEKLTGLEKERVIGKTVLSVMPSTEVYWIEKYGHVALTGESANFGNYSGALNKHYHVVAFCPQKNQFAVIFTDISALKQAEEQLRAERSLLNGIMDTSPVGISIVNAKGEIIYANTRAVAIMGLKKDEITQRTYNAPAWKITDIEGDPFPEEKMPFNIVMATNFPVYGIRHSIISQDGRKVDLCINASPIIDKNGRPDGMIAIIDDISEQIHSDKVRTDAERALRESENKYRMLTESIKDVVWILDVDSQYFRYVSPSVFTLRGYTAQEILAKPLDHAIIPDEALVFKSLLQQRTKDYLSGKTGYANTFTDEVQQLCKDGTRIWTEVVSQFYRNVENGHLEILGVSRDIKERKNNEKRINLLLEEKDLLLRETHHRIKNFMNTINSLLYLQASMQKEPAASAALKEAGNRVNSMMILFDELYKGKDLKNLDIKPHILSLVERIISNFPDSRSINVINLIDNFSLAVGQLQPVGIIINELLTNTMKYAFLGREKGTITVSCKLTGNKVMISVADDGVGIPDSIDVEKSPGFGLILVGGLCRHINASIRMERKNGTKFILEFEK